MANTTSGTATFDKNFAIDEIVEESFERIGLQNVAGYQLKSARRSLNILLQECGNRGIHYWEIDELDIDLIEGQAEYIDPVELLGTRDQEYGINDYKNFVSNSMNEGVTLIGGCCEVKPRHIEALSSLF